MDWPVLPWTRLRISRRSTALIALFWFAAWLFLNGLLFVHRSMMTDLCTDDKSRRILQRLCEEYQQGALTGDLCEDLCVTGRLQYKRCLYYEHGKKVMEADWCGLPLVLKSKLENFSSYEGLGLLDYQDALELSPADVVLYATLELRGLLGLEAGNATSPQLDQRASPLSRAELASLWALLQQEEYAFFRMLQDLSSHVVKVLGSCGHFYAVEHLVAGHAWRQHLFPLEELLGLGKGEEALAGRERLVRDTLLQIALNFLDMVKHFDEDFAHPLHLCDIKPENFALRSDLTVVAIDVDMAFFGPKMRDILEQNCTSDDDCNFFDCTSKCNMKKNKCRSRRANSNLQVICDKIFSRWFSPTMLGPRAGLPLEVELQRAVQQCAETAAGEHPAQGHAIQKRLTALLNKLLRESERETG